MRLVEGRAEIDDVDAFVARLDEIGATYGCAVTAVDARYVAGRRHLEVAVDRANRAFDRDDAIADDRGIEILLYAAGRRQIDQALTMGVSEGRGPVVVVIDGGEEADAAEVVNDVVEPADVVGAERDEALVREFFEISDLEVGATDASIEELVIERVVLLAIEK